MSRTFKFSKDQGVTLTENFKAPEVEAAVKDLIPQAQSVMVWDFQPVEEGVHITARLFVPWDKGSA